VDGAAEVEIRGETAILRNLEGRPSQWRRFVCNAPMPSNPAGFRFAGVDGRGRQTLVRSPEGGAPAIVRIEDPQGGSEGYTFDVFWEMGNYGTPFPTGQGARLHPIADLRAAITTVSVTMTGSIANETTSSAIVTGGANCSPASAETWTMPHVRVSVETIDTASTALIANWMICSAITVQAAGTLVRWTM
jgi:hypothetical protein